MFVIRNDVPIPPPTGHMRHGPRKVTSRISEVMLTMQVGGSFLVTDPDDYDRVRKRMGRFEPRMYTTRKVPGEGWRVWRIA